ncbi:MAG: phosphatase PAP2 family protein [Pseudomonadota bacterium]|nr:phosphatase PAP2 family protein [Pseudomonadota bacterium]
MPAAQFAANRLLWTMVLTALTAAVAGIRLAGWEVTIPHIGEFVAIMGFCAALSLVCFHVHRNDTLFFFGNAINQMICGGFAVAFLTYFGGWLNRPLMDGPLVAIDQMSGFDWRTYIAWINTHPLLGDFLTFSYQSFSLQLVLLLCLLFIYDHSAHGQRFVLVFLVSATACALLSAAFPAAGGYVYYDIDVANYPQLHPAAARIHEATLLALRQHELSKITFPMQGIVTFPSFHASLAVLLLYAAIPLRRFRLITHPLNLAMLFSTPVDGGHYLIDVVAGVLIALLAIGMAERMLPRRRSNIRRHLS